MDAISNVPRNDQDKPDTPVKIIRIVIKKVKTPVADTAGATSTAH